MSLGWGSTRALPAHHSGAGLSRRPAELQTGSPYPGLLQGQEGWGMNYSVFPVAAACPLHPPPAKSIPCLPGCSGAFLPWHGAESSSGRLGGGKSGIEKEVKGPLSRLGKREPVSFGLGNFKRSPEAPMAQPAHFWEQRRLGAEDAATPAVQIPAPTTFLGNLGSTPVHRSIHSIILLC